MRRKVSSKGGRPLKEIQPEMVEKLASIGCTGDEIAEGKVVSLKQSISVKPDMEGKI